MICVFEFIYLFFSPNRSNPLLCLFHFRITVINPDTGAILHTLNVPNTLEIKFSPLGKYLMSWERPKRDEKFGGDFGPNLRIFNTETGKPVHELASRSQGLWLQFTYDEKYCARLVTNGVEFYDSNNFSKSWAKLRAEGCSLFSLSPGQNYSVAVFTPEISGKPASVRVYQFPNFDQPVSQKTFFKAENAQMKWNKLGTALLVLGSTDVDRSGKSYYGETNLYLLGIAGSYDSRIHLDQEGTIHDFAWSPNSREFGVVYGFMPATTTIFDARGNVVHTFPRAPRNSILFSPHARFVLVAGFGNLQGTVDIYDRQKQFTKVATIEASNTSVCEWSPDGRYIMTATTSPRLRVDNGIKLWHYSGKLIFVQDYNELFAASWRPMDTNLFPIQSTLPPAPEPHDSAVAFLAAKSKSGTSAEGAAKKPAGAYVPPHARNRTGAPSHVAPTTLYERELNTKNPVIPGAGGTRRNVPGAPRQAPGSGRSVPGASRQVPGASSRNVPGASRSASSTEASNGAAPASTEDKNIRGLVKKLRAIQDLKTRKAKGEKLEDTQVKKIERENEILQKLAALGWKDN